MKIASLVRRTVAAALSLALVATCAAPGRTDPRPQSLRDDGRVGVVTDLQGTALVRPSGRTRWSPVGHRTVLLPGDELRTMTRGAHAAEVRLAGGGSLVLGPGAVAQLEQRGRVHLRTGDAEVAGAAGRPVAVSGPGAFAAEVTTATCFRAEERATSKLDAPPRWLTGYRGSTTDEWMGSLLAKVDGRDVALTVGYHKVDVVIRDQIAETTVEESFVNSTDLVLEGTFTFPLPADASIGGFGMWVGDEYVAADIVEKQRARAIYEDIKRRQKDPGLLEWGGGNLFRASVFPIPARGEKRIKIRYTQVLPLEGTTFRYRYALRSELLRTTPLRQLRLRVDVQSEAPLRSVSSPTHDVRVTQTAHTASVDFTAEGYTPDRDFEASFGLDASPPLRAIAHRRGEDGYLMLLLAPPDAEAGEWKRELVPEGEPLDLLFVADTSGSTGPAERAAQRTFLESALALLGPADRFRLMACDAKPVWLVAEPLAANEENAAKAMDLLDRRISLGWSDLDAAVAEAAAKAGAGTLVVYVGDGIGTTGDADPVALAQRISRIALPAGASLHAVADGSAYEQGVLEAMASHGGAVRSTGNDPAAAALSFLTEVAQPAVKDLRVEFQGLRTARVYPARLPNLPAGTQQIVLGRFLPEGDGEQRGRVTVTGTLAGKPVRWDADLVVAPGAEGTGNSFLPRLWARRHLDALLAEGRTPANRDEIVAFSERFGILTPYTSFLVLESDADRETYGVARRVQMRDGERFFTEARTAAATEALRTEMLNARGWRMDLRRRMLAEISGLGRDLDVGGPYAFAIGSVVGGGGAPGRGKGGRFHGRQGEVRFEDGADWGGPTTGGGDSGWEDLDDGRRRESALETDTGVALDETAPMEEAEMLPGDEEAEEPPPDSRESSDFDGEGRAAAKASAPRATAAAFDDSKTAELAREFGERLNRRIGLGGEPWLRGRLYERFPHLPAPPAAPPLPETTWDPEIASLLAAVSAEVRLADGARLDVRTRSQQVGEDAGWDWGAAETRGLLAPDRWWVSSWNRDGEPVAQWLAANRGVVALGTRLGRTREPVESDRGEWAHPLGVSRTDWRRSYAAWTARLVSREGAVAVVELAAPKPSSARIVLTLDTEKRVVLRYAQFDGEKPTTTWIADGHRLVGGVWWPATVTSLDGEGRETWRQTIEATEVPAERFDADLAAAHAQSADALLLGAVDPPLLDAKQAEKDGRAAFPDLLAIASDHCAFQRWDEAWAAWGKARALAGAKPGLDWIEASLLAISRQGERFAEHLRRLAELVAGKPAPAAHGLASYVADWSDQGLGPDERLSLLDVLEKAGAADADETEKRRQGTAWRRRRAFVQQSAGRWAAATALFRDLWRERPGDLRRASELMSALAATGDVDGAVELYRALDPAAPSPQEEHHLRGLLGQLQNLLWNASRFELMLEVAERWAALQPEAVQPHQDRLSALIALDRDEEFDRWVGEQLAVPETGEMDAAAKARLWAAVESALGNDRWGSWWSRATDPRWVRPLALVARRAVRDERIDLYVAVRIVNDHRWRRTDGHRELTAWLRADFAAPGTVEEVPAARLAQVLAWIPWDRNSVDAAVWRGVADRLRARLASATETQDRDALLGAVLHLLDQHAETAEAVDVLRAEVAGAKPERVAGLVPMLLDRLLSLPWTQEIEDEAFALVPRLGDAKPDPNQPDPGYRYAPVVRRLVDRLTAGRIEAALPPLTERQELPRADLKERTRVARADARRDLAAHLALAARVAPKELRPWYEVERLCLAAELGEDPAAVEADAREMLLSIAAFRGPGGPAADGTEAAPAAPDDPLRRVQRERSVLVLSYLAVRRNAPEGLADRVAAVLRDRLAQDAEALDWKYALFRLEVALDRPEALEALLREWIDPERVESRWRVALGRLLAETGRVKEAAEQFEEVAKLGELGESGFVSLAGWYLVLGDDVRRESALERRYEQVDEWRLAQRIWFESSRVSSRGPDGVPERMDDEILRVVRVLFRKATQPGNAVYAVRQLYSQVKDSRLLASLADGVIGHTPESTYAFLTASADVFGEVHEEATLDEVRARLEERLPGAATDTDRRGLRLLMVLVERRAAEVLDQRGPHAARALADLQATRKGEWRTGERRLLAEFLATLGTIPDAALAAEQVSQLRDLHAAEQPGTDDRLRIAAALWRTEWGYGHGDAAVDGLVAALDERRQAAGGSLPQPANDLADLLTDWHEATRKFGAGEAWLDAEAARQTERAQREWYARRTFRLYVAAMQGQGTLSFGSGAELYRAARGRIEPALSGHHPDQLGEVLQSFCALHVAAHRVAQAPGVADDLVAFSRTALPKLLPRFGYQGNQQVLAVSDTIHEIAGPLAALTLLVERLESERPRPAVRVRGNDGWQTFGWRMAERRREARIVGALEPRLLAVVLREMERDLLEEESHGRPLYGGYNGREFWREKKDDFLTVVRRVVELNPEAPGRLRHAAEYLWDDLGERDAAIRVLEDADRRGALREDGRWNLVRWHQELEHWAESLPHAARLVAERPDQFDYREANVHALHGVGRDDEGRALVEATRTHFADLALSRKAGGRIAARLADLCLDCEYLDLAAPLYEDALAEHRKMRRVDRGQGDAEASRLYAAMARALAGLKRFDEAVDAASGAVVAWAGDTSNRAEALESLRHVLAAIPDLPAWTDRWEKEAAASGLDAPVVRQALADLHLRRNEPDAALRHLLVARRQTPDDAGVHDAVIRAYEMKRDEAATCDALALSLHHLPRRPDVYVRLADGLTKLGRAADAERALTGLAEYAPNESEGHARLAGRLDELKRPAEAAVQWRQVVRVRTQEPAGWLALARSLAAAGRKDEARAALEEFLRAPWGAGHEAAVEALLREIQAR